MKKILFFAAVLGLAVFSAGCAKTQNSNSNTATNVKEPIFFYSNSCPHCQKVKEFIADNKIAEKVAYSEVAAFDSQVNLDLFNEKAAACDIAESNRGVPMIYNAGKCYVGEIEVENFLKEKAGL